MKSTLPLGIALSLFAALAYALQTAVVKGQIAHLPPLPVVIFFQSITSLLLVLPLIFRNGRASAKTLLSTQRLPLHLLRTTFSLSISYLLFYAVIFIPLVNGLLLSNTAPLIIPFLGYFFLSQHINHRLWVPMLVGYVGVACVLQPDARLFNPGSLLALGSAIAMASTMITVRKLAATENTKTTMFYFFLFSSIISGCIAIPFWVTPSLPMLAVIALIGMLYFFTQLGSTSALKYINAQLVGSLFYSNIIYAAILTFIIWHTLPTPLTLVGMILIIVGGILCIRVERKTHSQASQSSTLTYAKESS